MSLTIEKYLQVIPNLVIPEDFINRVLFIAGIDSGVLVTTLTQVELDTAEAEVWYGASGMSSGGGYSKRINNRQISKDQMIITDFMRTEWLERANRLRDKIGLPRYVDKYQIYDATCFWGA